MVVEENDNNVVPKRFNSSILSYIISVLMYLLLVFDLILLYLTYQILQINTLDYDWKGLGYNLLTFAVITMLLAYLYLKIWGAKTLWINKDYVVLKRLLFPRKKIAFTNIRLVDFEKPQNIFATIFGDRFIKNPENLVIYSLDRKMEIKLRQFKHRNEIAETIKGLDLEEDLFIKRFMNRRSNFNIYNIFKHPTGMFGLILVGITVLLYLWGFMNYTFYPPSSTNPNAFGMRNPDYAFAFPPLGDSSLADASPSSEFFFGTDFAGRDYLSRIIYGVYLTLNMCFVIATLTMVLAVLFGTIAGMTNSTTDKVIVNLIDVLMSIPMMVFWGFGLVYSGGIRMGEAADITGGFFWNLLLVTSFFIWAAPAKIIRNDIKDLRSKEFIQAQIILGSSRFYIFRKHILPGIYPMLFTLFLSMIVEYIMLVIGIAVLLPSDGSLIWGSDINRRLSLRYYPDQEAFAPFFIASVVIYSITIFGFLLLGNALRDLAKSKEGMIL